MQRWPNKQGLHHDEKTTAFTQPSKSPYEPDRSCARINACSAASQKDFVISGKTQRQIGYLLYNNATQLCEIMMTGLLRSGGCLSLSSLSSNEAATSEISVTALLKAV